MQLLSTVLVVPICQSIAESINCVRPGGQGLFCGVLGLMI